MRLHAILEFLCLELPLERLASSWEQAQRCLYMSWELDSLSRTMGGDTEGVMSLGCERGVVLYSSVRSGHGDTVLLWRKDP